MKIRAFVALLLAALLVIGLAPGADARVKRIEGPKRDVRHNAVTYYEYDPGPAVRIRLSDGSEWKATPCKRKRSHNCWWDASRRGKAFLDVRGRRFFARGGTIVGS